MLRIFSVVIPARVFTLFASELVLLLGAYIAAAGLDSDIESVGNFLQYDSGALRIGIVAAFVVLGLFFRNLYRDVRIRDRIQLFQNLSMIFGFAFIGQGVISYLNRELIIPRKVMLTGSVIAIVALFGWRLLFDRAASTVATARRVLFLGMSPTAVQLAAHFEEYPEFGLTAVGYLETADRSAAPDFVPRLGSMAEFNDVLEAYMPESIVIGKREDIRPWWVGDFLALRFGGVRIEEASKLYETLFARKCAAEIWPSRLIFAGALEPRRANVTLQWFYSQAIAFGSLLIAAPLMLGIAGILKASSRGGVFAREQLVGLGDEPFCAYSFRCRGADGRETRIGRVLQRWHLASLPRLFNVIREEMSIVGPRPQRREYVQRLSEEIPFYRQRHRVKPGLTGWAGVHSGRAERNSLRELEYDLYYVEHLSPMLDSYILLLTLRNAFWAGDAPHAGSDSISPVA